ncbi:MAG: ornithine cyclodeaminase [Rhodobacteraceae bacterium]|nr:MAG: ornithine cyclodeaminase [Paracoccaceae bacterium]
MAKPEISDQFLHRDGDTLLSRAAWIDGVGVAVKSVTVMPDNAAHGLPSVHGAMVLFEDKTGQVEAVIDSALVTKWKTAGDSVLGARLLARPDSKRLLIVGAGTVAASLIEAYSDVFPNIEISVWNRTKAKAEGLGVPVVDDLAKAVNAADIISCATMASNPVIKGEWLRAGQHLDLIGAFKADMREADDLAMQLASIFVDSRATTIEHIGELMIPIASAAISVSDVQGDLYDLVRGGGRSSDAEITLFKNGGGAHLDLMTGQVILKAWRDART